MPASSKMGDDRVAHWIETRENRFEAFIPSDNHSSPYGNESNGGTSTPPNSSISSGFFETKLLMIYYTDVRMIHRFQALRILRGPFGKVNPYGECALVLQNGNKLSAYPEAQVFWG